MSDQSVVSGESSVPSVVSAGIPLDGPRYRAALLNLRPVLVAMKPHECAAPINTDIPTIVTATMGSVVARIFSFRAQLAALPDFDMALVEKMEEILMALASAQAQYTAAYGPGPELQKRYEEALEHLQVLSADVQAAVRRGLMSGEKLKELRGANGYRNVAYDLMAVVQMMRAIWTKLEGRTGTTLKELDAAEAAAEKLNEAIGEREKAPAAIQEAADIRHRAYNLLLNCYNEARRGLTFLRWHHGDLESIAPSLFTGRGGRRKGAEKEPELPPTPPVAAPAIGSNTDVGGALPLGLPGGNPLEDAE